ncbi:MAG: hypothetical protein LBE22_03005 [Azoarcus sp.]|jgi:hypothetical protein|nr:hypothetical protein [Azoarcus sp.]
MSFDTDVPQVTSDEVEIRISSQGFIFIGIAVIGGVVSFPLLDVSGGPFLISIFLLILGIWQVNVPLIVFRQDYFETKLAPLAGHHKVLFSEVIRVEITDKPRMTIYYRTHNSVADAKPVRIKIPLNILKGPMRDLCIDEFHARLPESVFVA